MKSFLLVVICASVALALPSPLDVAETCTPTNCKLDNGCACATPDSPLGDRAKTPQFVTLTFDDSVTAIIYENYLQRLLQYRRNPDNSPITASFYIPHKYTDYQRVNSLYNRGHDIGVHSISKDTAEYFKQASVSLLIDEFLGQRQIISKFANISIDEIRGVRTPHFQLAGDKSFEAYTQSGLQYDNSWTTRSDAPVFPYTLNYKSDQQCLIGECPTESFPGFRVDPIINFVGPHGQQCNVLWACQVGGTVAEVRDWLIEQYERTHQKSRAPLSFLINSALFQLVPNSLEGLEQFLDYLGKQKDTFLVSHKEVNRWVKNPVPLENYNPTVVLSDRGCDAVTCNVPHEDEVMYMGSCTACPRVYPWVGNPEGKA